VSGDGQVREDGSCSGPCRGTGSGSWEMGAVGDAYWLVCLYK